MMTSGRQAALTGALPSAVAKARATLARTRRNLNSDELAGLIAPGVLLEHEIRLPDYPDRAAWMFSITGVLRGVKVTGAVFAGDCILIFAPTLAVAHDIAVRGLRSTVDFLHEEYDTRESRALRGVLTEGIVGGAEIAGRRAQQLKRASIPQQKKLHAIMQDIMGGKKWDGKY